MRLLWAEIPIQQAAPTAQSLEAQIIKWCGKRIIIGGNQHELTSGTDTVFVGGTVNKSSGNANQSVLIGGTKNTVGGRQAGIFGGTYNMTAGTLTSVYGGASNTVSGTGTAILGGWSNAASGLYSVW